jgi:aminoglycoside phosphotransferase (APT) family kinase protein
MTHVASYGYPVPVVYDASGTDLVMERLDGPTMLDSLVSGDVRESAGGNVLAQLHNQLHAVPPRLPDPEQRVLHLDLHPGNVLLCSRGPVVIDWRNTKEGSPDLDVALSALILAETAVGGSRRSASARSLLAAFLMAVDGDPTTMLDQAVVLRSADPNLLDDELDRLGCAAELVRASR